MFTTKSKGTVNLEDGMYTGKMSGYVAVVRLKKNKVSDIPAVHSSETIDVEIETVDGVRSSIDIPCTIVVKDGKAFINIP